MRVHIVYAHPDPQSLTAAALDAARRGLASAGHEVDLLDLHASGFQPVMSTPEKRAFRPGSNPPEDVADATAALTGADALALFFPSWWSGPPAIMKGYLDRMLRPGIAFDVAAPGARPVPKLTNIKRFAVVTSAGSPPLLARLVLRNPVRRALVDGVRRAAIGPVPTDYLCLYRADNCGAEARGRYLQRVERTFAAWS